MSDSTKSMLSGIYEMGKSVREYIDQNGGGTGGGGGGSYGLIASKMDGINFTGELPDIIFQKDSSDLEAALILQTQISATNQIQYGANTAGTNRTLRFDNSATAGNMTNNGNWNLGSNSPGSVSIQHFIDTDKAIYLGGGSSSNGSSISVVNQIQDNIDNIPLIGSGVQIPDAILIKDINATTTNGYDNLIQLDFALWSNLHDTNGNITSQHFVYETNNFVTKRWYIRFDSTDGSYISQSHDQHVKKEFNSIQEYISNDRAMYFGAGGGGGGSTSTPTTFAAITDTPTGYESGHYLQSTESGVDYVSISGLAQDLTDYGFLDGVGGSGGIGSKSIIKQNSRDFYTDLPDAIIAKAVTSTTDTRYIILHLQWVNPAGTTWQVVYRQEDYGDATPQTDIYIQFKLDLSGTNVKHGNSTNQTHSDNDQNLKWFIENDRAIYFGGGGGGGSSAGGGSNILAQGTYYAGAQELRNDFNISGVTKTQAGIFDIVFDTPIANREYNALVTPIGTSLINAYVDSNDENSIQIITRHNDSHARTDASFDFVVFGISGAGGGGGSSTFAGLTDTPSTLTEGSGQYLKVSDDGQTIEYVDLPAGSVGGIGDSVEVINLSNFGSKIPDVILLKKSGSLNDPRSYYFFGVDVGSTAILYRSNANQQISFVNNSAGDYDATLTNTSHVRYAGDTTLQSIIDNGHAIYFGGGGSSSNGGIRKNLVIKNTIPLASSLEIPDALVLKDLNGQFRVSKLTQVESNFFDYQSNVESANFYIGFDSTTGNFKDDHYMNLTKEFNTIQEYINAGRAVYYGGGGDSGGSSSTFSASSYQENILQGHLTTDNDANLNDLHFTGLETGAYYRLGGQARFVAGYNNAGTNMWFYAYQDSFTTDNIIAALNNRAGGTADTVNATHTFNHIFQATGDLLFAVGGMNSSEDRYIYGNGTKVQTYVQLEKL